MWSTFMKLVNNWPTQAGVYCTIDGQNRLSTLHLTLLQSGTSIYLAKITRWEVITAHSGCEAPSQSATPGWYKIAARCNQAGEKKNASHRHHGTSSPHLPDPQSSVYH